MNVFLLRFHINISALFFLFFLLFPPQAHCSETPSTGFTLRECYRLALKRSETLAIQDQIIKEAEGHFYQSLSGVLPEVSYVLSERRQDGRSSSNFSLREIPERKFTFSQPLFSGFKEFAAIAASRAEKRRRKQERKRAEELLFVDVADAFYLFLRYQDDVETLGTMQRTLAARVEELKKRETLGRSRPSEVAGAEVRLNQTESDLLGVQGEWEAVRQLLEFLTGEEIDQIREDEDKKRVVVSLDEYLEKGEKRSDVVAAFEAWQVSKREVHVAKTGFSPTVNMDGNYYTKRVGNSSGVDWDATLTVEVPLFKGGENWGTVKEAKAGAEQERLTYQQTKRQAALDVQNAYTRFETAVKKEEALARALQSAERNYELQKDDYQKSLVSNLDVLESLASLGDIRRDFTGARTETKRLYWNLQAAAGGIHDYF